MSAESVQSTTSSKLPDALVSEKRQSTNCCLYQFPHKGELDIPVFIIQTQNWSTCDRIEMDCMAKKHSRCIAHRQTVDPPRRRCSLPSARRPLHVTVAARRRHSAARARRATAPGRWPARGDPRRGVRHCWPPSAPPIVVRRAAWRPQQQTTPHVRLRGWRRHGTSRVRGDQGKHMETTGLARTFVPARRKKNCI